MIRWYRALALNAYIRRMRARRVLRVPVGPDLKACKRRTPECAGRANDPFK